MAIQINTNKSIRLKTAGTKQVEDIEVIVEGGSGEVFINGIIKEYKVNANSRVNAGDFVEFVTKYNTGIFDVNGGTYISACKLDNVRVLIAYQDVITTYGNAFVLSFINGEIITSERVIFNEENTTYISTALLEENKVVIAYTSGKRNFSAVRILTINENSISLGELTKTFDYNESTGAEVYIEIINKNKFIVLGASTGYGITADWVTLYLMSVENDIITQIDYKSVTSQRATSHNMILLNENKLLAIHRDYERYAGGYNYKPDEFAFIITISGSSLTKHSDYIINSNNIESVNLILLDENKILMIYKDTKTANELEQGRAKILYVNELSVTSSESIIFNDNITSNISAKQLNNNKFLITYTENEIYGKAKILTIDNDIISVSEPVIYDYNTTSYNNTIIFSENSALVIYNNGTGAYSGLTINEDTIIANDNVLETYVKKATNRVNNVGVAKTGGSEGQTIEVYEVRI